MSSFFSGWFTPKPKTELEIYLEQINEEIDQKEQELINARLNICDKKKLKRTPGKSKNILSSIKNSIKKLNIELLNLKILKYEQLVSANPHDEILNSYLNDYKDYLHDATNPAPIPSASTSSADPIPSAAFSPSADPIPSAAFSPSAAYFPSAASFRSAPFHNVYTHSIYSPSITSIPSASTSTPSAASTPSASTPSASTLTSSAAAKQYFLAILNQEFENTGYEGVERKYNELKMEITNHTEEQGLKRARDAFLHADPFEDEDEECDFSEGGSKKRRSQRKKKSLRKKSLRKKSLRK